MMYNGLVPPFYEIMRRGMGTGNEKTLPTQEFYKGSTGEHWYRKTIFHNNGSDLTNTHGEMDAKHRAAHACSPVKTAFKYGDTA